MVAVTIRSQTTTRKDRRRHEQRSVADGDLTHKKVVSSSISGLKLLNDPFAAGRLILTSGLNCLLHRAGRLPGDEASDDLGSRAVSQSNDCLTLLRVLYAATASASISRACRRVSPSVATPVSS